MTERADISFVDTNIGKRPNWHRQIELAADMGNTLYRNILTRISLTSRANRPVSLQLELTGFRVESEKSN